MPLSSFQLDLILWQGHALPVAAQIMREMQMPQVSAVGSQRESIWKEESWPIESEVIRRGIIQETVKPKIAANSLNNKITQGCANCQEAGLRGFLN